MVFDRYIKKHGRPFSVTVPNGTGHIRIYFYRGYVDITSYQPGLHLVDSITITHRAWRQLLRSIVAPTKLMTGPDFDRYAAMRESAEVERAILREKRQMKRRLILEARARRARRSADQQPAVPSRLRRRSRRASRD